MQERFRDEDILKRAKEYAQEAAIRIGMVYVVSGELDIITRDKGTGMITQTIVQANYLNQEIHIRPMDARFINSHRFNIAAYANQLKRDRPNASLICDEEFAGRLLNVARSDKITDDHYKEYKTRWGNLDVYTPYARQES